jgi:tetratricopeptide (TPR) repeat protein
MKRLFVIGVLFAAIVLAGGEARAQSTGTARGKVLDDKGQPIVDAKIAIEYQGEMKRTFQTKTSKKGEYTQVGLAPGNYRITASKDGYAPFFVETRINLGDVTYIADIKLGSAQVAAQAAAAKTADEITPAFNAAADLARQGKLDEAEAAYKALAAKAPTIPEIQLNLAYLYRQKKDWPAAEAAYKKALELRPNYSEANAGLLAVYQASGQTDKTAALATSASGDAKVQFDLGVGYLNSGKYDDALAAFQKAQTADASNAEVYYYLGTIYVGMNKIDDARTNLEKYVSMNPKNAQNLATAQGLLQALTPKK